MGTKKLLFREIDKLRAEIGARSHVEAELRKERVQLQGENEALRAELDGEQSVSRAWKTAAASNAEDALRAEDKLAQLQGENEALRGELAALTRNEATEPANALRDAELTQGAIEKMMDVVEALEKRVAAIEKAPTVKPGDRVRIKPGTRSLGGTAISDKPVYEAVEGVCIAQVDNPSIRWIAPPDSLLLVW